MEFPPIFQIFETSKVYPPIELLNVGVANPLITKILLSATNYVFEKKLSLKIIWVIKGFATPTLINSMGGHTLGKLYICEKY